MAGWASITIYVWVLVPITKSKGKPSVEMGDDVVWKGAEKC